MSDFVPYAFDLFLCSFDIMPVFESPEVIEFVDKTARRAFK